SFSYGYVSWSISYNSKIFVALKCSVIASAVSPLAFASFIFSSKLSIEIFFFFVILSFVLKLIFFFIFFIFFFNYFFSELFYSYLYHNYTISLLSINSLI